MREAEEILTSIFAITRQEAIKAIKQAQTEAFNEGKTEGILIISKSIREDEEENLFAKQLKQDLMKKL